MGLHDSDKSSDRRLSPRPNANDPLQQRMAHNTMSNTYRSASEPTKQRIAYKNGLILTYDQDNKISSAYGYIPELAEEPVLIIAKAGYDVYVDILDLTPPQV